ncbi:MAG TPA: hypothetical protein VHO28_01475 [Ignavibacteriales bacterium]|nr:hypothetical protein [Ignavibacteriales bacterium]
MMLIKRLPQIKSYVLALLLFSGMAGCSSIPFLNNKPVEALLSDGFDGNGIAVLTFSKQGNGLPSDIGKYAADKLTDHLFFTGTYKVIDRSEVAKAQANMEDSYDPEKLSAQELKKIAAGLNAKYIILGRVHNISQETGRMGEKADKEMRLTFRIISAESMEVIGMASGSYCSDDNLYEDTSVILHRIVEKMGEK